MGLSPVIWHPKGEKKILLDNCHPDLSPCFILDIVYINLPLLISKNDIWTQVFNLASRVWNGFFLKKKERKNIH